MENTITIPKEIKRLDEKTKIAIGYLGLEDLLASERIPLLHENRELLADIVDDYKKFLKMLGIDKIEIQAE